MSNRLITLPVSLLPPLCMLRNSDFFFSAAIPVALIQALPRAPSLARAGDPLALAKRAYTARFQEEVDAFSDEGLQAGALIEGDLPQRASEVGREIADDSYLVDARGFDTGSECSSCGGAMSGRHPNQNADLRGRSPETRAKGGG
jgi:hypothetical protein